MILGNRVLIKGIGIRENIDTSFNERKHVKTRGIIVELPKKLTEMQMNGVEGYMVKETLRVGEEVLLQWWGVTEGVDGIIDGARMVGYETIIGVFRDGNLVPINGFVLYTDRVLSVASDLIYVKDGKGKQYVPETPNQGDFVSAKFGMSIEHFFYQEFEEKIYCSHVANITATWSIN